MRDRIGFIVYQVFGVEHGKTLSLTRTLDVCVHVQVLHYLHYGRHGKAMYVFPFQVYSCSFSLLFPYDKSKDSTGAE